MLTIERKQTAQKRRSVSSIANMRQERNSSFQWNKGLFLGLRSCRSKIHFRSTYFFVIRFLFRMCKASLTNGPNPMRTKLNYPNILRHVDFKNSHLYCVMFPHFVFLCCLLVAQPLQMEILFWIRRAIIWMSCLCLKKKLLISSLEIAECKNHHSTLRAYHS